ncbi:DUF4448 domain-containing protein [Cellulophaga sp. 20_2_10]|uniref:DUF4448 domain-containing protein n=1 Tax=Cellulophaga sp. 20_2_10 TaxID=2942476 RepID=UPI00201AA927|nr:DUF4448 domain-containing protein [Cellulophaga sp. 20_2_10]MCL5244271.1 DUF4448 domain-containing protein [Cellulophaga sp. 20_2_10]
MKTQDLKGKPTDQLKGELNMLKVLTIALSVVVFLLFAICMYGLILKDNNGVFIPLMVVAFSTGSMIPMNYMNMKKIKEELKTRD